MRCADVSQEDVPDGISPGGSDVCDDAAEKAFHERLRHARQQLGLDQAQLAQRSLMPATSISLFESGKRKPSFENLKRLADVLDVSVDYLMERSDDPMCHWSASKQQDRVSRQHTLLSEVDILLQQVKGAFRQKV